MKPKKIMQIIKSYLTKRSYGMISMPAVIILTMSLFAEQARAADPSVLISELMAWNQASIWTPSAVTGGSPGR